MMTEADRAGLWAVAYLLMVGVAAYFSIFAVAFSFLKQFWG
jgi:hypothetical protein